MGKKAAKTKGKVAKYQQRVAKMFEKQQNWQKNWVK